MDLLEHYRVMAQYNRLMNARLYAHCAALTDAQRKRNVGAFFKSIHGTLNHLLLTDRAWLARFTRDAALATTVDAAGNHRIYQALDQEIYADFEVLRTQRVETDALIERWVNALTLEMLERPLTYIAGTGGKYTHPLWWAVSHLFNHQTHHRGQVTTLLMQLGHDPGITDLGVMLRDPAKFAE